MEVGFIGLGDMGQGIIPRLIDAGHKVTGWNRTIEKAAPLLQIGMAWADSPRQVAERSEAVISIVTDAAAVRDVALGDEGVIAGLQPGSVYLDMSTIDPGESRSIADAFAAAGLTMLDAPISGSPITLAEGKASIMVGGDRSAFDRVEPMLAAIGPKVSYIGASGAAAQMKVAINLCLIVEMVAFCEAVALAEKGGVQREMAVDAMLQSVVASPVMGYRGPFILEGGMPEKPLASVLLQQKDMLLALDLGRRQGIAGPAGRRCQRDAQRLPRPRAGRAGLRHRLRRLPNDGGDALTANFRTSRHRHPGGRWSQPQPRDGWTCGCSSSSTRPRPGPTSCCSGGRCSPREPATSGTVTPTPTSSSWCSAAPVRSTRMRAWIRQWRET